MRMNMRRGPARDSIGRKLDRASRVLRWAVPASGWLAAQSASAATINYVPSLSDIQITHTAGIGATQSIMNTPFMTADVPGLLNNSYVPPAGTIASPYPIFTPTSPAGTYQLVNTYTNPIPWSAGYTFPTGGPQQTTAFAAVGEVGGNGGDTSINLGQGTGLTQTNPGGAYPYASELSINVVNLVFAAPTGLSVGNFAAVTSQFPVAGTLAASASVSLSANLTYTYYATNVGTNTFSPQSYPGVVIGTSNFAPPTINNPANNTMLTFSNAYSFATPLAIGVTGISAKGYLDITGTVDLLAAVDPQATAGPGDSFFLPAAASSTLAPQAGNAFMANASTTNLSQSGAWSDVTGSPAGPPTSQDLAQFFGAVLTAPTTFTLNAPTNWDGLQVQNPGAAVTIASGSGNNTLTIGQFGIGVAADGNGISQNLTLSSAVSAAASQQWSVVSGQTLTLNGPSLNLGPNAVTTSGNVNISAPISGAGSLDIDGPGVVTLSGNNNYTGGTFLVGGELSIATDSNIGGPAAAITFDGGILQITGATITNLNSHAVNWSSFAGGFDIANAANTFTITQNIGNAAINSGSLTKMGPGALVLGGINTYFGPTTIDGGVLRIPSTATLNTASQININSPGGLVLSNGVTLANAIVVNTSGEFLSLPDANETATLVGSLTANSAYDLGIPNIAASLIVTGAHTADGPSAALGEGTLTFTANGSLTARQLVGPLVLGNTSAPLNLTLAGHSTIANLGTTGINIGNNQPTGEATISLQNQASLSAGAGIFELDNSRTSNLTTINLNGGSIAAAGFTLTPPLTPGAATAVINFNGGVITATASNSNFFPSPTGASAIQLNIGAGGAIFNTNGFNDTLNTTSGFVNQSTGGLTKNGAGALILGNVAASTYTGPTVINGGLFQVASLSQLAATSAVDVNPGGAWGETLNSVSDFSRFAQLIAPGFGGSLALSTFSNADFDFSGTETTNDINMSGPLANMSIGGLIATGGGPMVLTSTILPGPNANTGLTTYQLGGGATLELGAVTSGPHAIANGGNGTPLENFAGASTNVLVENGGAVWLTTTNTYSGSTTIQGIDVLTIPAADSPTGANQYQLEQTTLALNHLGSGTNSLGSAPHGAAANLLINGGVLQYLGTGDTSNLNFTIGAMGATLDSSGSGPLTFSNASPVAFATTATGPISLTLAGSTIANTISNVLSDPPAGFLTVIKSGTGSWELTGDNTYSGPTVINGGVLQLGASAALGNTSALTLAGAATLDLNGQSISIPSLTGFGTIDNLLAAGTPAITIGAGNVSSTFGGIIQNTAGSISIMKVGTGTLTLSGRGAYAGGTTIAGGTIQIAGGDLSGNGPLTIDSGALLDLGGSDVTAGFLSGAGTIDNLFAGPNPTLTVAGSTLTNAIATPFTGLIRNASGSVGLILTTGDLAFTANNTYTGGTTINAGAVLLLGLGAPGGAAGAGPIINNGSLQIRRSDNFTFSNAVSGQGSLTFAGAGVAVVNGSSSYTGGATISSGSVQADGPSPFGSGAVAVSNATLSGTGTIAGNLDFSHSATLYPGDAGSGTLTIGGLFQIGSSPTLNLDLAFNVSGPNASIADPLIVGSAGVGFTHGVDLSLLEENSTNAFGTPGAYVLMQVNTPNAFNLNGNLAVPSGASAETSTNVGPFALTNPQNQTTYALSTVNVGTTATELVLTVSNSAALYSFNYNAQGTTVDNDGIPIIGSQSADLTAPANWYNLSSGPAPFNGKTPGPLDIAQFDSTYANLVTPVTFNLAGGPTTAWAGLSVQSPGPAQYVNSLNATAPLVMTLSGAGLAIGKRGITITGTDTVLAAPLTLAATQTWNIAAVNPIINGTPTTSQALTINAPFSLGGLGASALTIAGSGNINLAAAVSDGGSPSAITTSSLFTGVLTLATNNSYSGGTNLGGGTVSFASPAGLGLAGSAVNFQGGTLQITGASVTNLNSYNINGSGAGPGATWSNFPLNLDISNPANIFTVSQNLTGTLSLTKLGGGTLVLTGTNTYSGGTFIQSGLLEVPTLASLGTGPVINGNGELETTANDSPGQIVTNNATWLIAADTTIGSVNGNGGLMIASPAHFYADGVQQNSMMNMGSAIIGCGGTVGQITGNGSLTVGTNVMTGNLIMSLGSGLSAQSSISIASGSRLDITNNALAINYVSPANESASVSTAVAALTSGYNGGNWTGLGLTSSTAASNPAAFSIGYDDGNADPGTALPNQLLIAYTVPGDAFLQGNVGIGDLLVVAQNFNKTGKDWAHGNFTYAPNGSVGIADLLIVAQHFGNTISIAQRQPSGLSPMFLPYVTQTDQTPEPGEWAVAAAAALGGLLRRRRRHR